MKVDNKKRVHGIDLKALRKKRDLTQAELAAMIARAEAGVSPYAPA